MKYCPKCGKRFSDDAAVCPQCGSSTLQSPEISLNHAAKSGSGFGIAALILSIVGFMTGFLQIGIVFDLIAIVLAIMTFKTARKKPTKTGLATAGCVIAVTSIGLCIFLFGGAWLNDIVKGDARHSQPSRIELKGTFLLEPSKGLDLSEEGLAPTQQYLLLVYDVLSDDNMNEELSSWGDSIMITMNDTNSYDQLYSSKGKVLRGFLENCGYAVSTSYGTLWGGSEPVRMIAAFAINGNDITDDCTAKVEFELSNNLTGNIDIARADIQTINLMDGVFAVEENPDAYQIARSVKPRAELCKSTLEDGVREYNNGNDLVANLKFIACTAFWLTDGSLGFSCDGNTGVTAELPALDIESVQLYYPDLVDKINVVKENIQILNEAKKDGNLNSEIASSAYRLAHAALEEIIEYFEAER